MDKMAKPGMMKGEYSAKKNMASVPMKGSQMKKDVMMGPDSMKVRKMADEQKMKENLRGKMA